MTPEAQKAAEGRQQADAARRAALNGIEAEWTTDRSNYDRCITRGVLGSVLPAIYNSGDRIVQGPGWFAFQNEMVPETRVIPTDGRKNVPGAVKAWMGNSVGHWEGDTLVVETRDLQPVDSTASPCRLKACSIERFTLADANTLDYPSRSSIRRHGPRRGPSGCRSRVTTATGCMSTPATRAITRCSTCSAVRGPRKSGANQEDAEPSRDLDVQFALLASNGAPVPDDPRKSFRPSGSVMSRPLARFDRSLAW